MVSSNKQFLRKESSGSFVKAQVETLGQSSCQSSNKKRYMALQIDTSDGAGATPADETTSLNETRGADEAPPQHTEDYREPSPSETTRRLVETFRRRGESASGSVSSPKWGSNVRPMSPVSESFLENVQTQRQRAEERVQVIKKLRQLKERPPNPAGIHDSCESTKSGIHNFSESSTKDSKVKFDVVNRGGAKASETKQTNNPSPKPFQSGALRHYGEIYSSRRIIPAAAKKDANTTGETGTKRLSTFEKPPSPRRGAATDRSSVVFKPIPRQSQEALSGVVTGSPQPKVCKPYVVPQTNSTQTKDVTKLRNVTKAQKKDQEINQDRSPSTASSLRADAVSPRQRAASPIEAREFPPTQRNEKSMTSHKTVQVDLRESNSPLSSEQDETSALAERDRADTFLVELAKAKAEILDLQKRLAAADNVSQMTREELTKVRQQKAPFWKRSTKKKEQQNQRLGSRTADDNEDFVKQLLNVVQTLPICDEICLRINLLHGEGGWEIVSARAENPRLKEEEED